MDTVEEEVAAPPPCPNNDLSPVAKGKRTKRQRPHSPIPFTVSSNTLSPSFSAASQAAESATAEEEDTARCLVLLSRGHFLHNHKPHHDSKQNTPHPPTAPAAASGGGGGVYACKTCNRVFSSFQALGGHRTSHKKPRNDKKTASFPDFDDDGDFPSPPLSKRRAPPSLALQLSSAGGGGGGRRTPPARVHECSYCGAEFASGQALGGHMRRHRAGPASPLPVEPKRPRNGLSLDLNFPAPEDEGQRFGYARREKSPQKMVMSAAAPALVDCHY